MTITILTGCCLSMLATLADQSVNTCVTSPPYWGLRDYGQSGQLGLEQTPEEYVANMVKVFREVRRVLRDDGTLWLNLGDSYAGGGSLGRNDADRNIGGLGGNRLGSGNPGRQGRVGLFSGLKPKDLVGIPWRVAFALQTDGWYLRQDIIWSKPNPMPESVRDRCTKAHEYIFLLTKSERYYYDSEAIKETSVTFGRQAPASSCGPKHDGVDRGWDGVPRTGDSYNRPYRNRRSVWTVASKPFAGSHFATYPQKLIEPCILAGSPVGGTILDPFFGAGTTGLVAHKLNRNAIGCELNPDYVEIARNRLTKEAGMFADIVVAA
jgi:DNA modification methylase